MILVDTSAWVEFLRDTGSPACIRVGELLGADLATCDAIRMELLAGARNERHRRDLGRLIARAALISMQPGDFDQAAALYRQCRGRGETVRVLMDCLIGALAIRTDRRFCIAMATSMPWHGTRRCASMRHDASLDLGMTPKPRPSFGNGLFVFALP